ncbi:MAG: recombinase family protein [Paludibacteraceae bacterium]|nr:recombinase family protein [Paludibacteraceae bacterium]
MKKYVSYCRVSTHKQGLGLEAQMSIIKSYVKLNNGEIIASYQEKESGKDTIKRTELQNAIKRCKEEGCILVVAKLDRLSRDVMDIFSLKRDKNLKFEVCDMDATDTLTLGIFATLAQKEREMISKRTKEALSVKKAAGVKLGSPKASETIRKYNHLGAEKRHLEANERNRKAYAAIRFMNGTLREKAAYLNESGFLTPRGKQFQAMQVSLLIKRYEQER